MIRVVAEHVGRLRGCAGRGVNGQEIADLDTGVPTWGGWFGFRVLSAVAFDRNDEHIVVEQPLLIGVDECMLGDRGVLTDNDLEDLRLVADPHEVYHGGTLDCLVEMLGDQSLGIFHRVDTDLLEDVHMLGVVDNRYDLWDVELLREQTDHDVRRIRFRC